MTSQSAAQPQTRHVEPSPSWRRRAICSVSGAIGLVSTVVFGCVWSRAAPAAALDLSWLTVLQARLVAIPGVRDASRVLDAAFSPLVATLMVLLACLLVWKLRGRTTAVASLMFLMVPWGISYAVKFVVGRPRPFDQISAQARPTDPSFPSGHTAIAAAFAVVVMILLWHRVRHCRALVCAGGVISAGAVALSRLVLGVHYPVDVIGAMLVVCAADLLLWGMLSPTMLAGMRGADSRPTTPVGAQRAVPGDSPDRRLEAEHVHRAA